MRHRIALADGPSFWAEAGETILQAAERQGVALRHGCTLGGCGACQARLLQGRVDYEDWPMGLSEEDARSGQALLCQARALDDLLIDTANDPGWPEPRRAQARVRAVAALSPQVAHLQLELDEDGLHYLPGQYMDIVLPDGGRRSFSMASPPQGGRVDFHVRRIPGGLFTEGVLGTLAPGDTLDVEIPLGRFRYHGEDGREILMAATGTGLAPLKAMLQALMDDTDCPPVHLYWGVREPAELYLADEIARWGERLYEFRFTPVLSRPGAAWSGRRGHVQDAIAQDHADLSAHAVYLCGSPAMVSQARERLRLLGASAEHLYCDAFEFSHPTQAQSLDRH